MPGATLEPFLYFHVMEVKQFVFNHFQVNCFVLWDKNTHGCMIVDPGCETPYEAESLYQFIEKNQLKVERILLTHPHIDHVCGLPEVCNHYQLPVSMHAEGEKTLLQAELYGSVMAFRVNDIDKVQISSISDGEMLGNVECRYVPGHCPGSMAFVLHEDKMVLTGDALFRGSIGRTDLPGGNYDILMNSIRTKLMTLPGEYEILPGHGDVSSIGEEEMYNGFLNA